MLKTYPKDLGAIDTTKLTKAIQALLECAQACEDACLSEVHIADLTKCARSNLDCRCVLSNGKHSVAAHGLRRQHHPGIPGGLRDDVQGLW